MSTLSAAAPAAMPAVVAHRGASKAFRENTIEAFEEAKRQGAVMVELDVRRTSDGALVVHHDAEIAGLGLIRDHKASEIPGHVPTLAASLDACRGIEVNIEIKNHDSEPDFDPQEHIAAGVIELLADRDDADLMLISSFSFETIDRIKELNDRLRTGFLYMRTPLAPLRLKALIHRTAAAGHCAIHPYFRGVSQRMVDLAHDVDVAVNTWTVDDPARMRSLAKMGVDAVITNVPAVAVDTFALLSKTTLSGR